MENLEKLLEISEIRLRTRKKGRRVKSKAKTIEPYKYYVRRFVRWLEQHGTSDLQSITQDTLDMYAIYLEDERDIGPGGRNPMIAALNNFCALVLERPELNLPYPQSIDRSNEIEPLTFEEIESMIKTAEEYGDYLAKAAMTWLYYMETRNAETRNQKMSDIHWKSGTVTIREGKGGYTDTITLHPYCEKVVQDYILHHRVQPRDGFEDYLFISPRRQPICKNYLTGMVQRYALRAGLQKRVWPHLFRHSAITHRAEKGATIIQMAAQSRHRDWKSLKKYVHLAQKSKNESYLSTTPSPEPYKPEPVPEFNTDMPSIKDRALEALLAGKISETTYNRILNETNRPALDRPSYIN